MQDNSCFFFCIIILTLLMTDGSDMENIKKKVIPIRFLKATFYPKVH